MADPDPDPDRVALEGRIARALREGADEMEQSNFSDYRDSAFDLTRRLMAAARRGEAAASSAEVESSEAGGRPGARAALDELDRLRPTEDPGRLRRALLEFLTHDPSARGLRVPSLEERAPGKVRPSRHGGGSGSEEGP